MSAIFWWIVLIGVLIAGWRLCIWIDTWVEWGDED